MTQELLGPEELLSPHPWQGVFGRNSKAFSSTRLTHTGLLLADSVGFSGSGELMYARVMQGLSIRMSRKLERG